MAAAIAGTDWVTRLYPAGIKTEKENPTMTVPALTRRSESAKKMQSMPAAAHKNRIVKAYFLNLFINLPVVMPPTIPIAE